MFRNKRSLIENQNWPNLAGKLGSSKTSMMEVLHISNEWWAVWAEHIKMQLKQQQLGLQSNFQKDPIARAKAQCIVDELLQLFPKDIERFEGAPEGWVNRAAWCMFKIVKTAHNMRLKKEEPTAEGYSTPAQHRRAPTEPTTPPMVATRYHSTTPSSRFQSIPPEIPMCSQDKPD